MLFINLKSTWEHRCVFALKFVYLGNYRFLYLEIWMGKRHGKSGRNLHSFLPFFHSHTGHMFEEEIALIVCYDQIHFSTTWPLFPELQR